MIIRPGPERLRPGLAPGGMVLHVYGTADGRLILEDVVLSLEQAEAHATYAANVAMAALGPDEDVCLVAFDGDTGQRWPAVHRGEPWPVSQWVPPTEEEPWP